MNRQALNSMTLRFRDALIESTGAHIHLKEFPHGSCRTASLLLSKWLNDNGVERITLVAGRDASDNDGQTHAWLQVDEYILDVTISQFHPDESEVLFENDSLHRRFLPDERETVDFDCYNDHQLVAAYTFVSQKLT